ncbi:MAG TPA: hypothetical protein VFB81_21860, partial [Myxococcales bacterium]|nr:hypothetical protein [Myxococcales bacterium]
GGSARQTASGERDHQQALALAELGLERTRAYLAQISAVDLDYDRALDPRLDTACLIGGVVTFASGTADDHLPPFAGGGVMAVDAGPANHNYLLVPAGGGAYLVRIDDNEDDETGLYGGATGNNATTGCLEGTLLGLARQDPVRDRDRTVTVTVIGIYPGTNPATARAIRTLRTSFGPGKAAGIYAGGDVDMSGASKACGEFADLVTTGTMEDGCLCHAGCSGGPPLNRCSTLGTATCDATAAGTCAGSLAPGGTCQGGAVVPPPPKVAPFDPTNAPLPCTAAPCTPFYYLRHDPGVQSRVFQWNYAGLADGGCTNPRQFARLCAPGDTLPDCPTCWSQVLANATAPYEVKIADDASRVVMSPGPADAGATVWTVTGGLPTSTALCNTVSAEYPDAGSGYGIGPEEVPGTTFHLEIQPPAGVWIVEGNMDTAGVTTAPCATHDGRKTSLIVVGNMTHTTNDLTLLPASAKGYALLVGRDMRLAVGNTTFSTCATGGAVMVREQFTAGANDHLEGQLIVGNQAVCSAMVSGDAISTSGNFTVHVSGYPLVETGGAASTLSWAESTY